jgi:hypothetical protein
MRKKSIQKSTIEEENYLRIRTVLSSVYGSTGASGLWVPPLGDGGTALFHPFSWQFRNRIIDA